MEALFYKPAKVIAEIGCNHKGSFETALELIDLAKRSGADVAKFQKRNSRELLTDEQYSTPHPNPSHAYGTTYGEHREALEFSQKTHSMLMEYCRQSGIEYSTSVWDLTSAWEIIELNPSFIKVPSACNTNFKMLQILRDYYKGDIHISVGMTTGTEERDIVNFFELTNDARSRVVLYSCTSGYPVPFSNIHLLELVRMQKEYGRRVKQIGFSGHHLGIAADIAAYTLGASWIERHFTKDRTWKGTDHAASLEPRGLENLVRDLAAINMALTFKPDEMEDIELTQRNKLKYREKTIADNLVHSS